TENDKVFLFMMDYSSQTWIKLWGRAEVVEDDPELVERLMVTGYEAKAERAIIVTVEALDLNCRQHTLPRYTLSEIEIAVTPF
ncbi:MAG: pyridoxamine 5'-phosphate oxidase, partial [Alphaproteobacteria bacterium]|nr:pyridoxamine 5'-phosphate oxidase [Alphaproteobacteria bacterium]